MRHSTSHAPHQAKSPQIPHAIICEDLEYTSIRFHIMVQESMCCVILDHDETQERHRSKSPGKIQVQRDRILQGSPLQLQSQ